MRNLTLVLTAVLALAACDSNRTASITRPESLLDISSERVTFGLSNYSAKQDVTEWIGKDRPARAELQCLDGDAVCGAVAATLRQGGVPYTTSQPTDATPKAVLVYERIVARVCDPRYKNDSFNQLNRPHASLGCATSSNILQQVSEPTQFTSPAMLGDADGQKAVSAYKKYQEGKKPKHPAPPPPPPVR